MRDPARIVKITKRLQQLWEKNPDLRLSQLIMGVEGLTKQPLYYMEDDDLIAALEEHYRSN